MFVIGIDPGKTGAICFLHYARGHETTAMFSPISEMGILEELGYGAGIAGIEIQVAMPRQKGAGLTMKNYGILLGLLMAFRVSHTEIRSQDWYKFYGIRAGMEYKARKKETARIMSELYPGSVKDFYGPKGGLLDGRTDALAIAHYTKEVLVR